MKIIILTLCLIASNNAFSYDFENLSVSAIREQSASFKAPAPQMPVSEDDEITAELSLRVPFKAVKKIFLDMSKNDGRMALIDNQAELLYAMGDNLIVKNLKLNINGIMAEPVLILKPYLEGKNKVAVKIEKVKFHVLMMPDRNKAATPKEFKIEDVMEQVMGVLIEQINTSLNEKFKSQGLGLLAKDVLQMKYYKNDWILRASVSGKFVGNFIPAGLLGEPMLTGFSFDDKALYVKVKTGK